jgi:glycosyltransferase involved in cell wall biosynthesis
MPQNALSLSVVICAHNEQEWITQTLASLLKQRRLPDEIVVVNNASSDNTEAVVRQFSSEHPTSGIKLVYQAKKGLHHAREAGWRAASGDIIINTDADITFPENWLELIEKAFSSGDVDAITGIVRYQDALPVINWLTWACDQVFQPEGIGKLLSSNREYILNGGNSAYRRSVLEAVNGYLDKPADLLEDRWMSRQMLQANYRIKFLRNLKVWHSFRRFSKDGWRGYWKYIFGYTPENVYPDHLADR